MERAKALVWWDAEQAVWTGHDISDFAAGKSPHYRPAQRRSAVKKSSARIPWA